MMIPILASASPRRRELLHLITDQYDLASSSAEEDLHLPEGTPADEVPVLFASAKARDIANRNPGRVVIGADTVVIGPDGEILGKPLNEPDAARMLALLSGCTHRVVTGVCLCYLPNVPAEAECLTETFSVSTDVTFYPLSKEEIRDYVATGEPMDKAGAYGIQGAGSVLVEGIRGDFFNVVGLPVARLKRVYTHFIQTVEER